MIAVWAILAAVLSIVAFAGAGVAVLATVEPVNKAQGKQAVYVLLTCQALALLCAGMLGAHWVQP